VQGKNIQNNVLQLITWPVVIISMMMMEKYHIHCGEMWDKTILRGAKLFILPLCTNQCGG